VQLSAASGSTIKFSPKVLRADVKSSLESNLTINIKQKDLLEIARNLDKKTHL
jgi:hypothetical protein